MWSGSVLPCPHQRGKKCLKLSWNLHILMKQRYYTTNLENCSSFSSLYMAIHLCFWDVWLINNWYHCKVVYQLKWLMMAIKLSHNSKSRSKTIRDTKYRLIWAKPTSTSIFFFINMPYGWIDDRVIVKHEKTRKKGHFNFIVVLSVLLKKKS